MVTNFRTVFPLLFIFSWASSAPTKGKTEVDQTRQQKSLPYFEYYQPEEIDYNGYDPETEDYVNIDVDENELSRTIPSRKRYNTNNRPQQQPQQQQPQPPFNSPIYYIRMPPQPYMFIPGLGYVSQPSLHHMSQFLNVPVSFVANGKPSTIYQWSGGLDQFSGAMPVLPPSNPKPKPQPQQPPKPADSTVHRLPGTFTFNGKPEDIYVLRDSYNSLYSDALQNFYP